MDWTPLHSDTIYHRNIKYEVVKDETYTPLTPSTFQWYDNPSSSS